MQTTLSIIAWLTALLRKLNSTTTELDLIKVDGHESEINLCNEMKRELITRTRFKMRTNGSTKIALSTKTK